VLSIVSSDPGYALDPFPEDALNLCESEVIPAFADGRQNLLLALELSMLYLVLQHPKQPKVARTYIRRIRWAWSSFDASLVTFPKDFVAIVTH
jgi:hypothetical protein